MSIKPILLTYPLKWDRNVLNKSKNLSKPISSHNTLKKSTLMIISYNYLNHSFKISTLSLLSLTLMSCILHKYNSLNISHLIINSFLKPIKKSIPLHQKSYVLSETSNSKSININSYSPKISSNKPENTFKSNINTKSKILKIYLLNRIPSPKTLKSSIKSIKEKLIKEPKSLNTWNIKETWKLCTWRQYSTVSMSFSFKKNPLLLMSTQGLTLGQVNWVCQ